MTTRIRTAPVGEAPMKEKEYERTEVVGSPGIFVDQYGSFWAQYDFEGQLYWLRCLANGVLRDQKTSELTVFHNKVTLTWQPTKQELDEVNLAVRKKMEECFPNDPYLQNKIPLRMAR